MSDLILLDDAIIDLVYILVPYEHDDWEQKTFYDKSNNRFIIRYRQVTYLDNGSRIFTDSVTIRIKYNDAIQLLKENNSKAFYDKDLKEVKGGGKK